MDLIFFFWIVVIHFHLEYPRSIVHRSAHEPGKWQYRFMVWWIANTPRVEFISPRSLARHPIGIGPMQACGTYRLGPAKHDFIFGFLLTHSFIIVDLPFRIV